MIDLHAASWADNVRVDAHPFWNRHGSDRAAISVPRGCESFDYTHEFPTHEAAVSAWSSAFFDAREFEWIEEGETIEALYSVTYSLEIPLEHPEYAVANIELLRLRSGNWVIAHASAWTDVELPD